MLKHGLLWRRPEINDGNKSLREGWDRAFSKPWSPEKCIVPQMQIMRVERIGVVPQAEWKKLALPRIGVEPP